ncbi:hypothetical protein SBA4_7270003 [Candidatus Sulfopaludibacter sp. SbA4]|nr:hypothetical protein SBA4_7270003 [Candidatus Sulfopaludibacter sp. SbA4]
MRPVTTGPGISGAFADELETMTCDFRAESKDQRWHLYIQVLLFPEYSLRVYAPDGHTEPYTIVKTLDTAKQIRGILAKEAEFWKSRVRGGVALTTG